VIVTEAGVGSKPISREKKIATAVAAVDISPEIFRDLLARSVTLAGIALVSVMILGLAAYRIGVLLQRLTEWVPF
jgi:hypothetical protein